MVALYTTTLQVLHKFCTFRPIAIIEAHHGQANRFTYVSAAACIEPRVTPILAERMWRAIVRPTLLDSVVTRPPVAIGGVGGSGTRVVARIAMELGWFLGDDLNEPNDALLFTLLFKHREILSATDSQFTQYYSWFKSRMCNGTSIKLSPRQVNGFLSVDRACQHDVPWLIDRLENAVKPGRRHVRWGWKEPNTHMVLDRLLRVSPNLKYIHVVRDGVYMAQSTNQNQLRLWGPSVLGPAFEDTSFGAYRFWLWAQRRALAIGAGMGKNFFLMDYDSLCRDPKVEIARLANFLDVGLSESKRDSLSRLVQAKPQKSNPHLNPELSRLEENALNSFEEYAKKFDQTATLIES